MPTGTATNFDLTVGEKLDVEDFIYILTPTDVPVLGALNGTDVPAGPQRSLINMEDCFETKVEWQEEDLLTPRSTLAADETSGSTSWDVASGDGIRFQEGHVLRVGGELVRVTAVSGDTLTVTRNFASSGAEAHTSGDEVVGVGTALAQGSDPKDARFQDRTMQHNLTQIFGPYKVEVSSTEEAVEKYGIASEFDKQGSNRIREVLVEIEQTLIYGVRSEDTTNKWRTMNGLINQISSNVDSSTTTLDGTALDDNLQNAYDNGGVIDTLLAGLTSKRTISSLNAGQVRLPRNERVRGSVVDTYESDFGVADVVLDRHVRDSDLFGLDRQFWSLATLRALVMEMLAKTGDAMKAQVVCEKTSKLRLESRHCRWSALS